MGFLDGLNGLISNLGPLGKMASGLFNVGSQIANQSYMKRMQQETWNREDTAMQRRVADLKAAGLSPVLAAGQGAASSSPIQVGAPQSEANGGEAALALLRGKQEIAQSSGQLALLRQQKLNAEKEGLKLDADVGIRQRNIAIADRLGISPDAVTNQWVILQNALLKATMDSIGYAGQAKEGLKKLGGALLAPGRAVEGAIKQSGAAASAALDQALSLFKGRAANIGKPSSAPQTEEGKKVSSYSRSK